MSLFASVLFSNISIAEGLAPVTKGMGYSFSLQQGMSGNFTTNQVPSLPIPTMTDIPAYVKSHNNSLPEMWGLIKLRHLQPIRSLVIQLLELN